jgi:hypothetical protein
MKSPSNNVFTGAFRDLYLIPTEFKSVYMDSKFTALNGLLVNILIQTTITIKKL